MKRTANEISRYDKDMANSKGQVTKEEPKVSLQKFLEHVECLYKEIQDDWTKLRSKNHQCVKLSKVFAHFSKEKLAQIFAQYPSIFLVLIKQRYFNEPIDNELEKKISEFTGEEVLTLALQLPAEELRNCLHDSRLSELFSQPFGRVHPEIFHDFLEKTGTLFYFLSTDDQHLFDATFPKIQYCSHSQIEKLVNQRLEQEWPDCCPNDFDIESFLEIDDEGAPEIFDLLRKALPKIVKFNWVGYQICFHEAVFRHAIEGWPESLICALERHLLPAVDSKEIKWNKFAENLESYLDGKNLPTTRLGLERALAYLPDRGVGVLTGENAKAFENENMEEKKAMAKFCIDSLRLVSEACAGDFSQADKKLLGVVKTQLLVGRNKPTASVERNRLRVQFVRELAEYIYSLGEEKLDIYDALNQAITTYTAGWLDTPLPLTTLEGRISACYQKLGESPKPSLGLFARSDDRDRHYQDIYGRLQEVIQNTGIYITKTTENRHVDDARAMVLQLFTLFYKMYNGHHSFSIESHGDDECFRYEEVFSLLQQPWSDAKSVLAQTGHDAPQHPVEGRKRPRSVSVNTLNAD